MSELRAYIKNLPYDIEKSDLLWELRRLNVSHTGRLYLMKSAAKSSQYAQCSAFVWCSSNEEVAELVGKVDGQFMAASEWHWWLKPMRAEEAKPDVWLGQFYSFICCIYLLGRYEALGICANYLQIICNLWFNVSSFALYKAKKWPLHSAFCCHGFWWWRQILGRAPWLHLRDVKSHAVEH